MRISIVLFENFELLDVFGPVELFSFVDDWEIEYLTPSLNPIASKQGVKIVPTTTYADYRGTDLLLVPGGHGTRVLVHEQSFIEWLGIAGSQAKTVTSVCTGSALLAQAGLLEGYRATSNKISFTWASSFGKNVTWEPAARWVQDGNRWTSSGITAGIDMAAALIAEFKGEDERERICHRTEIVITKNPQEDSFAVEAEGATLS
ncbi:MAG: DJ-1/PfpI family protein [Rothia sp. (in: high G+C Gram-positive bacteria)]|nr:DJ-1/PfpI family protein [Rothia sp. (in: high G+C Gram-positive bacteria)]